MNCNTLLRLAPNALILLLPHALEQLAGPALVSPVLRHSSGMLLELMGYGFKPD